MTKPISRRAYAKRRHVSEGAIRKRISDGTLTDAMMDGDLIDPDVADRLLAENTTTGRDISSDLVAAKRRKAAAACALLEGEIKDFGATLVPAKDVADVYLRITQEIAKEFLRIGELAAGRVARKPPAVAFPALQEVINDTLTRLSSKKVEAEKPEGRKAESTKSLSAMTLTELAAVRANLLASRLELRHELKAGRLILLADVESDFAERASIVRTNVLSMPARFAPYFEHIDVSKSRELIDAEVVEVLTALATPEVPIELITGGRKPRRKAHAKPMRRKAA